MQLKRRIKNIGKKTSEILEREFLEWIETLTDEELENFHEKWLSRLKKNKVFNDAEIKAIREMQMHDEEVRQRINEHNCQN